MEIVNDNHSVKYDSGNYTVSCAGSFRLTGAEYARIDDILNAAADAKHEVLSLDLTELEFLNSSGINMLCKFMIRIRKHQASQLSVQGNSNFPWQKKTLANFQKLIPDVELDFS